MEDLMEEMTNAVVNAQQSAPNGTEQAADNEVLALSEVLGATAEDEATTESQEAEATEQTAAPKLNGGIKGRLLESEKKGYEAGRNAAMAEWQAEKARMLEEAEVYKRELNEHKVSEYAAKIAKDEGCSLALATRLARMELGLPAQAAQEPSQPQRDPATGRFVKNDAPAANNDAQARAQFLYDQAETIKRATGFDAMALFGSDPEVQKAVLSGQKDFADIAKEYGGTPTAKRTPSPVRTSGEGQVVARSFKDMTDEQFDALQDKLSHGRYIDLRR